MPCAKPNKKKSLKPGQKVDPQQAEAMAEVGCPVGVIAERLGCTERHARRLTAHVAKPENRLVGTRHERHIWDVYHRVLGSYAKVAWCFGVTRQAVRSALTTEDISTDD